MNRPRVALHLAGILLLCVPIAKQLRRQRLRAVPWSLATAWQVRAEEIMRMNMKGRLTDAKARSYRRKLFREICDNVRPMRRAKKGGE
mgnify:CR=1 FL=1